jgi:type IV pilus assembly protein PilB
MGIEPFLIAYAINLIVAQRLVRTLCSHCKRPDEMPDHEMLARLGFTPQELATTQFYVEGHNPNCQTCGGSGFKGRRAITETMAFSHEIRRLIVTADRMIDEDAIRQQAISEGMLTLRGSAREIVMQGEMSITELIRTTAGEQ